MIVQLEYIKHLLLFFTNISHYTGIMLNAFSDLLCLKLCWHNRLVPSDNMSYPNQAIFLTNMNKSG